MFKKIVRYWEAGSLKFYFKYLMSLLEKQNADKSR
jgi:hypothetical protein